TRLDGRDRGELDGVFTYPGEGADLEPGTLAARPSLGRKDGQVYVARCRSAACRVTPWAGEHRLIREQDTRAAHALADVDAPLRRARRRSRAMERPAPEQPRHWPTGAASPLSRADRRGGTGGGSSHLYENRTS